jgi:hypothetical protein
MLSPDKTQGPEDQHQQKFSNCKRPLHDDSCLDMEEFNRFLSKVSTKSLLYTLMTYQQRIVARAFWSACNSGGNPFTGDPDDKEDIREYCEWILRIDHRIQWKNRKKFAKL